METDQLLFIKKSLAVILFKGILDDEFDTIMGCSKEDIAAVYALTPQSFNEFSSIDSSTIIQCLNNLYGGYPHGHHKELEKYMSMPFGHLSEIANDIMTEIENLQSGLFPK